MIQFFRKNRRNLLAEGKTSKYLKYAIGEIVLVVVGILIALSINNWNEQQNLKRYEMIMLNEIRSSLQEDYARCRDVLSLLSRQVIDNDSIIKSIKTELKDAKTIEGYFEDGEKFGIKIEYTISNKDLATAGQLKTAEKFIDDTFVCMEILFLILILKI